jgi:hypothetical protein
MRHNTPPLLLSLGVIFGYQPTYLPILYAIAYHIHTYKMTVQTPTSSTIPLHRIRFYDQTPSPITCLAYPPTALPAARDPSHKGKARAGNDELGVLVVARENGDVEIHQWARENEKSFGNWTCHRVSQRARAWTLSAKREMPELFLGYRAKCEMPRVRWVIERSARWLL